MEQHHRRDPQRDVRRCRRRPREHRELLYWNCHSQLRCDRHLSVSLHNSRVEHERNGHRSVAQCIRAGADRSQRSGSGTVTLEVAAGSIVADTFAGNGFMMTRLEQRLHTTRQDADVVWHRLRHVAFASLTLWLAITFVGVVLTTVA